MGLIHGIFYTAGEAFFNADTIIPIFLSYFTNSKTLIGLSSTLIGRLGGIASVFPQLFVANRMETNSRKKPLLIFAITIRALSWGVLALSTYIFNKSYPYLTIFFLFFYPYSPYSDGRYCCGSFLRYLGKIIAFYAKGPIFRAPPTMGWIISYCFWPDCQDDIGK